MSLPEAVLEGRETLSRQDAGILARITTRAEEIEGHDVGVWQGLRGEPYMHPETGQTRLIFSNVLGAGLSDTYATEIPLIESEIGGRPTKLFFAAIDRRPGGAGGYVQDDYDGEVFVVERFTDENGGLASSPAAIGLGPGPDSSETGYGFLDHSQLRSIITGHINGSLGFFEYIKGKVSGDDVSEFEEWLASALEKRPNEEGIELGSLDYNSRYDPHLHRY